MTYAKRSKKSSAAAKEAAAKQQAVAEQQAVQAKMAVNDDEMVWQTTPGDSSLASLMKAQRAGKGAEATSADRHAKAGTAAKAKQAAKQAAAASSTAAHSAAHS